MGAICTICGLPSEEEPDEMARWGIWCETCYEDMSCLGIAMLLSRSGDDAKGHWFYLQEWRKDARRASEAKGLTNCDKCGFLLRASYPIGSPKLCVHCTKGRHEPAEDGAAFLRIPQKLYLKLDGLRAQLGVNWEQFLSAIVVQLSKARGSDA